MPEVRSLLKTELHRELKQEAAREGIPLKELIARILQKHTDDSQKAKRGTTRSK